MTLRQVRVFVRGKVQGVYFRESTRKRAAELRIRGWVKNLPSGDVEALFCGTDDSVQKILEYVKVGPPMAAVSGIETVEETPTGDEWSDFKIVRE